MSHTQETSMTIDTDTLDQIADRVENMKELDDVEAVALMRRIDVLIDKSVDAVENNEETPSDAEGAFDFSDYAAIRSILSGRGIDVERVAETDIESETSGLKFTREETGEVIWEP